MKYSAVKNIVYMATNKIDGKKYIGCTTSTLYNRKAIHKFDSKQRKTKFGIAIDDYGWDNFEWSVLYVADETGKTKKEIKAELEKVELEMINKFNTYEDGNNGNIGGHGTKGKFGKENHFHNKTHTEESKRKMSEAKKGKYNGDKNPKAKLTEKDALEIIDLLKSNIYTQTKIAEIYNVTKVTISDIKNNKTWKHLPR
ncbi:NUMOD3 domain-containing DNA-binding protein [Priestia aryabhattai]|uniref:NUMOD3 domain-containing DNA-binding protein n=1 Tax=Priestia aryabhattai TaxID=412384 RepID=UPI0039A37FD1